MAAAALGGPALFGAEGTGLEPGGAAAAARQCGILTNSPRARCHLTKGGRAVFPLLPEAPRAHEQGRSGTARLPPAGFWGSLAAPFSTA